MLSDDGLIVVGAVLLLTIALVLLVFAIFGDEDGDESQGGK